MPAGEQPRGPGRAIARRRFLQVLGGLGLAAGISYLAGRRVAPRPGAGGGAAAMWDRRARRAAVALAAAYLLVYLLAIGT
jgi:hypothetical protein